MKRLKPVKARDRRYDQYDNPMIAVSGLWITSSRDSVPGLSREESVLASLHSAAVYVERILREKGVSRDRVRAVVDRGQKIGEDICLICAEKDQLNLPPTVGIAGDIFFEVLGHGRQPRE